MNKNQNITSSVLEKIRKGEVSMRPKIYFGARVALLATITVLAFLLSVFVLSFTLFALRESGEQFLLGFGGQGLATFLSLFPWETLGILTVLLVVIEWLFRSFKFGYRIPILLAFLGVLGFTVVAGMAINFTPFHAALLGKADRGELPLIGEFYESVRAKHEDRGVFRGVITSITGNELTIFHDDLDQDQDDIAHTVTLPAGVDAASFRVGERIYVAATSSYEGNINAYGIQKFSSRE
jgi:hypothetical protein